MARLLSSNSPLQSGQVSSNAAESSRRQDFGGWGRGTTTLGAVATVPYGRRHHDLLSLRNSPSGHRDWDAGWPRRVVHPVVVRQTAPLYSGLSPTIVHTRYFGIMIISIYISIIYNCQTECRNCQKWQSLPNPANQMAVPSL